MATTLHWWEGQFYCEFLDDHQGGRLRVSDATDLVWEQAVTSALAALSRATELREALASPHGDVASQPLPVSECNAEGCEKYPPAPPR
jgi:hypothetical protein